MIQGSSFIMAGYNVPEKTCTLQQNHLQSLNVSEGKLTLAAAFEQCIFISSYRNEASSKTPIVCSLLSSLHHNMSQQLQQVYMQSQVHTASGLILINRSVQSNISGKW